MDLQPAIDASTLPPQLRRLVLTIGVADTLRLLKARGGTVIKLPRREDRSYLRELLGADSARALIAAFEGEPRVELPKADKILAQLRDREIRRDHLAHGVSLPTLAVRHDLTVRQIKNICAAETEPRMVPDRQLSLLDAL